MIVCHCNLIDHHEIEATANRMEAADPWGLITPVAVYKALGKRPRCGGCLPLAANIIHTRNVCATSSNGVCPFAPKAADTALTGVQSIPIGAFLDAAE